MPEPSVVLVTGASSGFGMETATLLSQRGFRVFGTSRKPSARAGLGYEMIRLDVDSDESVNECVVEPGFFRTKLGETRHTSEERITDYDQMRDRAVKALEEDIEKGGDPRTVAEKILRIVESRSPRLEYLVGKSGRYRAMKLVLPESSFESGVRRRYKLD